MDIQTKLVQYFSTIDSSIEKLSMGNEGKISELPSWTLTPREVNIGITQNGNGLVFKIIPNQALVSDTVNIRKLNSIEDLKAIISPWKPSFNLEQLDQQNRFCMVSDMSIVQTDNPLAQPVIEDQSLIGWGNLHIALNSFTEENTKKEAINLWNKAILGGDKSTSFIHETKGVFDKFAAILKRKSFLERRIHRFIHEHSRLILPSFTNSYYEHPLRLREQIKKADFILEREQGMPPILIELENPVYKIFRKNGELTEQANHAKNQIADWVSFIEQDGQQNATGKFAFLSGPKLRLVIMGRGLEDKEKLLKTKFTDTSFWTYDLLLLQAKQRWNDQIRTQCKLIGLAPFTPF